MLTSSFVYKRVILSFVLLSTLINCSSDTQSTQNQVASQQPIKPKLYLEHSGSMFGYDGSKIKSNLRDAVLKLINTFPESESIPISIVNDTVYKYPQSLVDLTKSSNLFQSNIGNTNYTDFHKIFTSITTNLRENELSILTTDLIHSNVGGNGLDAEKIRSNALNLARLALRDYAKDGALLIMQLKSAFLGDYYTYNKPTEGQFYEGNRPVYILLFARNATMDRLLADSAYANFRNFSDYPGFQNVLLFSNSAASREPFYTLEESDPEATGSFNINHGDKNNNGIHAIKDLQAPDKKNQKLTLCVAIELPSTYGSNELLDTANYEVKSLVDGFKLKIVKMAKGRKDKVTHRLFLEASHPDGSSPRMVTIRLKRNFPPRWVSDTTDTSDDTQLDAGTDFAHTTFGLLPLLTGISEAYDNHASNRNYLFTCTLYIN